MLHTLADMTLNNPIFIFVVITVIWFIPGIIVRRITKKRMDKARNSAQAEAIAKLYPKERGN